MKINYNISAMIANNALKNNDNKLTESTKRLSTGMKVAGAKDNPSGLAMSRRMNAQIRSLDRSTDNASDGISVIQTADGALHEVHDILQRMNELAIQAANGTNSASDLQNIQDEINELKDEIERISEATQFNGQVLMDGTFDMKGYATVVADSANPAIQATDPKLTLNSYSDKVDAGQYVIGGYGITPFQLKSGSEAPTPDDIFHAEYDERTGEVTLYDSKGVEAQDLHIDIYRAERVGDTVTYELYMQKAAVTVEGSLVTFSTSDGKSMEIDLKENFNRENGSNVLNANAKTVNLELTGTGPMTMQIGANEGQTLDIRIPPISLENLGLERVDFTRVVKRQDVDITDGDFTWAVVDDITANIQYLTTDDAHPVPDPGLADAAWDNVKEYKAKMDELADKLWDQVNIDATPAVSYDFIDEKLAAEIQALRADPQWLGNEDQREGRVKSLFDERYRQLSKDIDRLDTEPKKDGNPRSSLEKLSEFYSDNLVTRDWQRKLDRVMSDTSLADWQKGLQIDSILHSSYDAGMAGPHSGADDAITAIGNAIKKVSAIRAKLGAYQNRLEHTVKSNDGTSENMTAAYSRIMDVDMAEEMTVYSTQQVLSQAGTSMLAQANERPSQILQLLQ